MVVVVVMVVVVALLLLLHVISKDYESELRPNPRSDNIKKR